MEKQMITKTGLVSAPRTDIVKYDSTWSYEVSHNPQTDRFSSPYPNLFVIGSSPNKKGQQQQLPNIPARTSRIGDATNKRLRHVRAEADCPTGDEKTAGGPGGGGGGSGGGGHRRLKFGDKILVEHGALTLGDVEGFFKQRQDPPGSATESVSSSETSIVGKIKIHRLSDGEQLPMSGEDFMLQRSGEDKREKTSFKVSIAASRDSDRGRDSVNFFRLRTLRDADEGMSLRGGKSPTANDRLSNKGTKSSLADSNKRSSRKSSAMMENTLGCVVKNSEFTLAAEGPRFGGGSILRHKGSILRKDSKKPPPPNRGSVAFDWASTSKRTTEDSLIGHTRPEGTHEDDLQEGSAIPIDRHEGRTREFEELKLPAIKKDEQEEGTIFKLLQL